MSGNGAEPGYSIVDPRPLAAGHPYTFFLPEAAELDALAPGDFAKLIFKPEPGGGKWESERMWVEVVEVADDELRGALDNQPEDMPGVRIGMSVAFRRSDVVAVRWASKRFEEPPPSTHREHWERCLVDRCVLADGAAVHLLYREPPEALPPGQRFADSGWRIRGDYRGVDHAAMADREMVWAPLGAVLNTDDAWLHLIDEPVGTEWLRDWTTGTFQAVSSALPDA